MQMKTVPLVGISAYTCAANSLMLYLAKLMRGPVVR